MTLKFRKPPTLTRVELFVYGCYAGSVITSVLMTVLILSFGGVK
jgi:hypothetical protein